MARLAISLVTDYPPSQINNVDLMLVNENNINESHFRIFADFPNHLNLRDGVVLTAFTSLVRSEYKVILRIFFNQAPYVVNRFAQLSYNGEDSETTIVITAPE